MKLDKFELDKKLSVTEMKQVKAGSICTSCGGRTVTTNFGKDSDVNGNPEDWGL